MQPTQPRFVPLLLPGPADMAPEARAAASVIEIELAGGHRLRADAFCSRRNAHPVVEDVFGKACSKLFGPKLQISNNHNSATGRRFTIRIAAAVLIQIVAQQTSIRLTGPPTDH